MENWRVDKGWVFSGCKALAFCKTLARGKAVPGARAQPVARAFEHTRALRLASSTKLVVSLSLSIASALSQRSAICSPTSPAAGISYRAQGTDHLAFSAQAGPLESFLPQGTGAVTCGRVGSGVIGRRGKN